MDDGVTEVRELVFSDQNDNNMSPAEKKQRVEENDEEAENGAGMEDETKEEDENEGGILNSLISSLVSPRSKGTSLDDEKMVNEEKGGGSIFNNLISGILHRDDEKSEQLPTEKEGGGFIDNVVSQLSSPLPDDAAPATDEASILIHSIVHD